MFARAFRGRTSSIVTRHQRFDYALKYVLFLSSTASSKALEGHMREKPDLSRASTMGPPLGRCVVHPPRPPGTKHRFEPRGPG